jgi:hypothetical protein
MELGAIRGQDGGVLLESWSILYIYPGDERYMLEYMESESYVSLLMSILWPIP